MRLSVAVRRLDGALWFIGPAIWCRSKKAGLDSKKKGTHLKGTHLGKVCVQPSRSSDSQPQSDRPTQRRLVWTL